MALGLNSEFQAGLALLGVGHIHREKGFAGGFDAVRDEVKFAIRRDKGDRALILEPSHPHALVELDIVDIHRFPLGSPAREFEEFLVVEADNEVGGAAEVALHLERALDLGFDDLPAARNQHVHLFHHVEETFIFAVFVLAGSPRDL